MPLVAETVVILLASMVAALPQNTASLTIGGTVPSLQNLTVSAAKTAEPANPMVVTLKAASNADASYAVTIQSKALSDRPDYHLICNGHLLTLAPGTVRLLAGGPGARPTQTILEISNPRGLRDDTLILSVISQ